MTTPGKHEPPEPLAVDGVMVVVVGTILWAIALALMLVFHDRLSDAGHGWWIWVGVAGTVLGAIGVPYLRRFQRQTERQRPGP